jgi:transposase
VARSPYSEEFRSEAVRLAREPGNTIRQVARELGVSYESLRKWVHQADVDDGCKEGLTTEERDELRRLRKENHRLRQERDIS